MKKLLLTAIVLISFGVQQISAQVIVQDKTVSSSSLSMGDIRFGAKAGLNISTFINKDYFDVTPKIGLHVGGMAEIPFSEEIFFQPELLLSFQGADIGPGDLNLVYIHLPLMGKYHITEQIAAEFGPQIGFVVGDNASDYLSNVTPTELQTNKLHLALNFGGGYRLDDNLYFQVRFSLGLTKVIDEAKIKNGVFQLGGSYFF